MDVLVRREKDGEFTTSVYRKSSHSDRYLHFSSDHPLQQKISGLQSLKYRAFAYCSNAQLLTAELNHLKKTFLMNGYSLWLIDNILSGTKLLTENILQQSDPEQQINEQKMRLAIQAV